MRLPRVRITLGMLLFAVAIAALNFAASRGLYQSDEDGYSFRLPGSLPFWTIGFVPLIEVALIGSLLLAAKRLRSLRARNAGSVRRPSLAFTYFSLHFLAIAVVAVLFAPKATEEWLETASWNILEPLGQKWGPLWLWPFRSSVSQLVQRGVLLCALLSGPPLILSVIGRILARRSAANLPRYRFRALTVLVSLGFAGVAFAIAETPRPFNNTEDVPLDFLIVDKDSGEPINAAFIIVKRAFPHEDMTPSRGLTGPDGRARLPVPFRASGECNLFRSMGSFEPWGRWLEVSAPHHQSLYIPLTDVLTSLADLERPGLPTIALARGEAPEKPFADIAGDYDTFQARFRIEPDGRFVWHGSVGCTGPSYQEYGRLTRVDGELVLAPFPQVAEETHPAMTLRYRPIVWGHRLFLCSMETRDLQKFLRENLRQEWHEPYIRQMYYGYVRRAPCDNPQTGLPQLPARVWIDFAIGELSFRDEDSTLRRAIDPFVLHPFRKEKGSLDDMLRSIDVSLAP